MALRDDLPIEGLPVTPVQRQMAQVQRIQAWLALTLGTRAELKEKASARLGFVLHDRYLATSS